MDYKDYYRILAVDRQASADDIKKAYRKLARKYHPDVSKEADASERMAEVNEANAVLSDPEKRAAYDALADAPRRATVQRNTKETKIRVDVDLDRTAEPQTHTGLPFFDHMLEQIGKQFGLSRERVRQIERETMAKLRDPQRADALRDYLA